MNLDPVMVGLAVAVVAAGALFVWRQPTFAFVQRSHAFLLLVRGEVRKVTWPSRDDLRRSTVVITILVIIIGVVIGLMDFVFSWVLIDFLGRAVG